MTTDKVFRNRVVALDKLRDPASESIRRVGTLYGNDGTMCALSIMGSAVAADERPAYSDIIRYFGLDDGSLSSPSGSGIEYIYGLNDVYSDEYQAYIDQHRGEEDPALLRPAEYKYTLAQIADILADKWEMTLE